MPDDRPSPVGVGPARPVSTRRRLGRAWLLTTLTNAGVGLVVFVVAPWAANVLGPDGRGRLTAIQLLPQMLADLSSIGLGFSIVHYGSARRDSLRGLLRWSIKPAAVATVVMFAIGQALVRPIVGDHAADVTLMRLYLLICPLTAVLVVCAEGLRALGEFGRWNLFTLARGLSWPLALVAGLAVDPSLGRVVGVHLALVALVVAGLVVVLLRRTATRTAAPVATERDYIRYGVASAASAVPRTANAKLDQVVMSFRVSDGDLGLYSAAVGWSAITLPVMRGFAGIAMPHVSEVARTEAATRVRHIVTTALVAAAVLVVAGMAATAVLWHWRFDADFDRAFGAALILIPAGLMLEYNSILGNVLRSLERPGLVAVLEVAVLVVSTAALLVVLTHDAVTGPALVSLGTYVAACALYVVVIARTLGVPSRSLVDLSLVRRLATRRPKGAG